MKSAGSLSDDDLQREHIWATKNRISTNNRDVDYHERRRLGNFVLLEGGINRRVKEKDIENKLDSFLRSKDTDHITKLNQVYQLDEVVKKATAFIKESHPRTWIYNRRYLFHRKINDIREQKLINFALERWRLKSEKKRSVIVNSENPNERDEVFQFTN